ncbi:hypothetical protein F9K97_16500 [Brucella anthropi]|uniref:hypothetical protein n=1 Tax=Brucella anthropi TaxID=529 RepID=UPI00124CB485|nr:hypothetical protein [Brucella anthropi]KAB2784575.1 hypothetical protein F9K97_16500 [Brucella anthropi]
MNDFEKQRLEDNNRACMLISREVLEREPELIPTTWFEYRFMSPWERTKLFERSYAEARQKALALRIGTNKAKDRKLYSVSWTTQNRELTKLWKARQRADELCLPYGEICNKAFGFTELANRKNICLPEQLIPDWHTEGQAEFKAFWSQKMFEDIDELRWINFNRLSANLSPFRREFGTGLAAQKSLKDYLVNERQRQERSYQGFFKRFALQERLLDDKAAREIAQQVLKVSSHAQPADIWETFRAEKDSWLKSGQPGAAAVATANSVCTLQGCYGLMHNFKGRSDCETCPQFTACEALSNMCEITTCGKIGGMDPTALRKRQKATERKRKSRRKAAAVASAHSTPTSLPNMKAVNAK